MDNAQIEKARGIGVKIAQEALDRFKQRTAMGHCEFDARIEAMSAGGTVAAMKAEELLAAREKSAMADTPTPARQPLSRQELVTLTAAFASTGKYNPTEATTFAKHALQAIGQLMAENQV